MHSATSVFDDLADDFLGMEDHADDLAAKASAAEFRPTYTEVCRKCGGTGRFMSYTGRIVGQCFTCKGVGHFTRLTSPETRATARASYAKKTAGIAQYNWDNFAASSPAHAAWIMENVDGNSYSNTQFAESLRNSVRQYGSLTPNQAAAIDRNIATTAQRAADAAKRIEDAPVVETSALEAAFHRAASGLKSPKLRVGDLVFSLASASSQNAGAVYVKESGADGAYLGKVMGGKFLKVRACDDETAAKVAAVAADPKGAAIRYGREFGCCSICGRTLTDPSSIEMGIGPICAAKFGF